MTLGMTFAGARDRVLRVLGLACGARRSMATSVALEALLGYGQMVLCGRRRSGVLVFVATLAVPMVGICGAIGGAAAVLAGRRLARFESLCAAGIFACNGALTGMALGAFLPPLLALPAAAAGGALTALVVAFCSRAMERFCLPPLSVPFVLTTWLVLGASGGVPVATHGVLPPITRGLEMLSLLVFSASASVGAALVLAAALHSWRQAVLMVLVQPVLLWLAAWITPSPTLAPLAALNMELALLAVSVVFLPGRWDAGAIAALVAWGVACLLDPWTTRAGLPMLVAPFNLATLAVLVWSRRLQRRQIVDGDADARVSPAVLMVAPFFGCWQVSQGPGGLPTHQGEGRHAWDFVVTDGQGSTHRGLGLRLEDYHAFGVPVRAPVDGVVACVVDGVDDNLPPQENREDRWGNHVIIEHAPEVFVMVAHLRNGSVSVRAGERLSRGATVGACGSSGRSLEPHIHVQAQTGGYPSAPTLPAAFVGCAIVGRGAAGAGAVRGLVPRTRDAVQAID